MSSREFNAVLVGNPNSGKSTLFNCITGAKQRVGNFPGVTVERYEGTVEHHGEMIRIVDLPGIYSLSTFSDEEKVAVDYLNRENLDVVVNVVDASNLERNLYLTLLLKEQKQPMIVVLNMFDVATRRGLEIDTEELARELGVPVLTSVGNRRIGVEELLDKMVETAQNARLTDQADKPAEPSSPVSAEKENPCCSCKRGGCCSHCSSDFVRLTTLDAARYSKINQIGLRTVRSTLPLERSFSDRLDAVLTNKYAGIPIFFLAMYVVFQMTFTIGQYPMDWLENGFALLSDRLTVCWPDTTLPFLKSLLIDGVIGGVGGVLVFLPNILILFLFICLLEDSGYMARAALLSDRWMHKIGLHGRSIVPLLVGFGCTVPALMATKMLSDRKERLTTMFVLPLFSCSARFPIYALFIPAFFPPAWRGPVLWLIYFIGIALAVIVAKVMSNLYPKEEAPFIIELVSYHIPTFRTVGIRTLERGWQYMKKAGTVILGISIVLWLMSVYPKLPADRLAEFEARRTTVMNEQTDAAIQAEKLSEIDDEEAEVSLKYSLSGRLGSFLEPVLRPMGFDARIGTALIGAFAAKEVFVAQMGIVSSFGSDDEDNNDRLVKFLQTEYTPLIGFCIILFCLIATPCMATVTMMAKEAGSWKWAFAQWGFLTLLAWVIVTAVYQIGSRLL